ncbi:MULTISPECIES: low temperature requirement protein A [unclassified Rhizobium]|uniref:low temperature requirement protein A n=1 Tax=unclassified Rhizobium TaxID=2613769 RepID=UPI000DE0A9DA|nr:MULTISPECIES: low temperature requirement protein A [unclassified Rhizobium]MBB3286102.1 low temperature requirement protein LtrA [Rhizobium sp. BK252]MBB3400736.1 low temperature requirement protein LtrA [Rhizobium sp. BK289]MBB3413420.1 low temperature requirement protein LtrA [Rhizobium sp. BK284]MBB3481202.1 low temperature requirement protein LtrA [Rhizobium sp. BK347]
MILGGRENWLRAKGSKNESKVSFVELFFDLVFVFSISQLAHSLAEHFTPLGALEAIMLIFAVWWVWVFTAWVTNWLDPDRMPVRIMLFTLMFAGLILSAAIPKAFGEKAIYFAGAYVFMQVGRSLFTAYALKNVSQANHRNFLRITSWLVLSGIFWISGALLEGETRLIFWLVALIIEYSAPALGFRVPGLGKSTTEDWDVSGAHLAERCALFIIICLGEAVLQAGKTFAEQPVTPLIVAVFITAFVGTVALWWIYFQFGHERASHRIEHDDAPGRLAREAFTYAHILILGGIILSVVGDEFLFAHPHEQADMHVAAAILGGPAVFLIGNLWFKGATTGRPPLSHIAGIVGLALLLFTLPMVVVYQLGILATAVLIVVAIWEFASLNRVVPSARSAGDH